jgi:EpsI family protein
MNTRTIAWVLAVLMGAASVASIAARPSAKASQKGRSISLKNAVPEQFGDWVALRDQGAQVVNPQVQEQLKKLYSETLTRTYVNSQGYRIMLSLAYGEDQRGTLRAHKPEICYPAQGFKLQSNVEGSVVTDFGTIPVRRLNTSLGERIEPVTYWFAMGDRAVMNNIDKRIVQLRLALSGQILDGLLFRVSAIDADSDRSFRMQDKFVNDLLRSLPVSERVRLSGLSGTAPG